MARKLIVCADGTWNRVEATKSGKHVSTNVSKLAAAVRAEDDDGNPQYVRYLEGVGTNPVEWLRGGMFGFGISRNIGRAYEFLVKMYKPGDEIWIFGFSRGAFTARSLGGMIRNSGLLKREHIDQVGAAMALYRDRYDDTAPDAPRARIFRNTYSHEPKIKFIGGVGHCRRAGSAGRSSLACAAVADRLAIPRHATEQDRRERLSRACDPREAM